MSRIGVVVSTERTTDNGHGLDVVVDPGGTNTTRVEHYADPGDDSVPLPSDFAALEDSSGTGGEHCAGYADVKNAGKAAAGEKRIYARRPDGSLACEVWLKGDETIEMSFGIGGSIVCQANGDVVINGVVISKLGKVSAPLDVVALANKPTPVSLALHVHTSAAPGSPTSGPIPAGP